YYTATLPSIYQSSSFWTSSPTFFALRAGLMLVAVSLLYGIQAWFPSSPRALGFLERLGRHSLLVYWIHVELVYGYATWPIHGRLRLWQTAMAFAAFSVVLYGVVTVWHRRVEWSRRALPAPGRTATASKGAAT